MSPFSGGFENLDKGSYFSRVIFFSYLEPPVEEMESNDKEAVDDGFESFDSEDFEDAGQVFSNFSCMFLNPKIFSNLNSNCSNSLDRRNLQEQVKKAFCSQKLF